MLSQTEKNYLSDLNNFVREKGLTVFYPEDSQTLRAIASQADSHVHSVQPALIKSREIATRLARLSLYDIVLLLDDSGSMHHEEGGRRKTVLRTFLKRIATIAHYFDPEGISIRFLNHDIEYDYIKNEQVVEDILQDVFFQGPTHLGGALRRKVVDPIVLEKARNGALAKPVLVTIITDGEPYGEKRCTLKQTILHTRRELQKTPYGDSAIAFQIAQVGNCPKARAFVRSLSHDKEIGNIVGDTAEEGIEQVELRDEEDEELNPDLWLVKLMVGAIDKEEED